MVCRDIAGSIQIGKLSKGAAFQNETRLQSPEH